VRRAWFGALTLATLGLPFAGSVGRTHASRSESTVHSGCPPPFTGYDTRAALVEDAIAAARTIALDHIVENNQGRITRRTRRNYPVLQAVELATGPALPAQEQFKRIATKRCGHSAALASWAVVFTDTESPVCCIKDLRFAIRLKRGWWVF
jgi:hypothetical protein